MLIYPNAKINIGLNVLAKRKDGFHSIETVFYPVPIYDMLEMIPAKKFSFTISGTEFPGQKNDNICIKTFRLLQEKNNLTNVDTHLHKNIPIGSGLGGGSSNAANMLLLMNNVFKLKLTKDILFENAKELGSDVPFFLHNKPILATGRGEVFTNINFSLKGMHLTIIYPNISIDTKESYKNIKPQLPTNKLLELITKPLNCWKKNIVNDFEKVQFSIYPILRKIKTWLYNYGAIYASMSGSGSAIYGIFESKIPLESYTLPHRIFHCKLE